MNPKARTIGVKILKWTGITIGSLLLLMFLIPMLFPGTIATQVKAFANKKLTGELNFSQARLTFFDHFPSLTVSLDDFSVKGSAPFEKDTLVSAEKIGFGINLTHLIFDGAIAIDEIYVDDSRINVLVDAQGRANYNIYVSGKEEPKDSVSETELRLDKIKISNCHLRYEDKAAGILVHADDFNYKGTGSLDQAVFDLKTKASIGAMDFTYQGESYLFKKNIEAELITRINTNALTFSLRRNDLKINRLPLKFKGELSILKEGYLVDMNLNSLGSDLEDVFTAMPPEYVTWLDSTKVKGEIDLTLSFKGRYDKARNQSPTLAFSTRIRDGFIQYKSAPIATSDINMSLNAVLPTLDTENLHIGLDSLVFKIGDEKFRSHALVKGLKNMQVKAMLKGKVNLEKLDESLGVRGFDFKGMLLADVNVNGTYNAEKHLFPLSKGRILLQNGALKTPYYPNPISDINLDIQAENTNGKYADTWIRVAPASFSFEGEPFQLQATFSNLDDVAYDVKAKGKVNVGKVYQVFKQDGLDVDGMIRADLALKGRQSYAANGEYAKLDNRGTLELRKINARMDSFPKAFLIDEGLFRFSQEKMLFEKFRARYGQSDFALNGQLINAINYFFESRGTLHGSFDLHSNFINVNEFFALKPTTEKASPEDKPKAQKAPSGVVQIPKNLDVALNSKVSKITYDAFNLENLGGTVGVRNGQVIFDGTRVSFIGTDLFLDGTYADASPLKAGFDLRFQAKHFDVQRAYKEVEMFRELATSAKDAQGIISLDYKLKGVLDGNMAPIYNSLEGNGVLTLQQVKISGMALFGGLSSKTGSDQLKNPDLSKVDVNTHIKDNIIYVDETKVKVSLFRLKFRGQTSFDGALGLKIRVGLPPLGLIGIPVVVTGTTEAPKFKVFSKTTDPIPASDYPGKDVITQPKGEATPVTTEEAKPKE